MKNFLRWQKGWPNRLEITLKAHLSLLFFDPTCGRKVAYPWLDFSMDSMAVEFHFCGFHCRGIPFYWIPWPWNSIYLDSMTVESLGFHDKKGGPIDWKSPEKLICHSFSLILPVVARYPTSGRMNFNINP